MDFSQQLAIAVTGIIGVGAWFFLYKKPADLSRPDAVGGLPHSPELSRSRMSNEIGRKQVHEVQNQNPNK